jgi:hypothetical protein
VRPARLVLVSEVGAWPPQDLNGIFSTNSELLNASFIMTAMRKETQKQLQGVVSPFPREEKFGLVSSDNAQ